MLGSKLFMFGGLHLERDKKQQSSRDRVAIYNDFEVFDTARGEWETPPVTKGVHPPARHSHTATLCGHKLYIIGGTQQQASVAPTSLTDVYCLDTKTWMWSRVDYPGESPEGLVYHSAILLPPQNGEPCGTKILVIGRRIRTSPTTVYVFDTVLCRWFEVATVAPTNLQWGPLPRIGMAAALVGNLVYLFGGINIKEGGRALPARDEACAMVQRFIALDISPLLEIEKNVDVDQLVECVMSGSSSPEVGVSGKDRAQITQGGLEGEFDFGLFGDVGTDMTMSFDELLQEEKLHMHNDKDFERRMKEAAALANVHRVQPEPVPGTPSGADSALDKGNGGAPASGEKSKKKRKKKKKK